MDMNQPKPSLSKRTRTIRLPIRDDLMIPNNDLSAGVVREYEVPYHADLGDVYFPIDRIRRVRMDHPYEYDFYVSGGMTGHEHHNFPMFHAMTSLLRSEGFKVFNPAENFGGRADLSRSTYMRRDQSAITRCDNILLLPSWKGSEGAIGEVNNALSIPDMGIFMFIKATNPEFKPIIIKLKR